MRDNYRWGAILSATGSLVGLVAFYLFTIIYHPMIQTELDAGRPDEAFVVRYVFPALGYLAITAGVLWMLALYGFLLRQSWAWMLGIIAGTISLLSGFFPMIPAMSREDSPWTVLIFVPNLILWLGLLLVRKTDWRVGALAFFGGIAYILSFMDGVATIDKIQITKDDTLNGLYVMTQEINWWGTITWAVFIFALLGRKPWARIVGLGAALLSCLGGFPIAVASTVETGRFSLFAPAPLLSLTLLVILLLPGISKMLADWADGTLLARPLRIPGRLPQPSGATR